MCGIIGVFGQITHKEETVFKQMLEVDSLRGRHSTGVVKVTYDGTVSTKKKAVDGMDFVKLEGNWITQGTNKVLIGHNRWATKGAVNDVNAHPFTHKHIHGVHNGTLTTQMGLKDQHKFEVDSDNIFYDIAHGSVEKTVPNLRGAFAIALYDELNSAVKVFRNSQRELAMATVNNGRTVIIASEYMMLEWVLMRNGYHDKDGVPTYELVEFIDTYKEITLLPFAKNDKNGTKDIIKTMTVKNLEAPKVVVAKAKKPEKTLKDYSLDSLTYYPLKLVGERSDVKPSKSHTFTFEMLCPPFERTEMTCYNEETIKRIRRIITTDGLVAGRVNIPYSKRATTFVTYANNDVKCVNDEVLKLVKEKPVKK